MTLRTRLLWLFIPLVLLTLLIVNSLSQHLLLSRFDSQDGQLLVNEAKSLSINIDNTVRRNLDLLRSYAWWDDSYEFAQGLSREKFARRNLDPDSLINLGFDFMVYADNQGRVFGEQWVPPDLPELPALGTQHPPSLESLRQAILERSRQLGLLDKHASVEQTSAQILLIQGIPLILVSSPISNNQGSAAPIGNVLAGLFLDAQRLAELQTQMGGTLQLLPPAPHPGEHWQAPLRDRSAFLQLIQISPRRLLGPQQQRIELQFHNLRGEPELRMQISQPRTLYQQGRQAIHFFLLLAVTAALVALLLIYLGLERWVLSRVQRLHAEIARIGGAASLPRLSDHGDDELGQLSGELNRMLERLEQSEARDRAILDTIHDGYFELDEHGRIIRINRAVQALLGYPDEQLLGHSFRDILSAAEVERAQTHLLKALSEQGATIFAAPLKRQDGSLGYFETSFAFVRDSQGRFAGYRGILRDISDQVAYQNQLLDMAYRDPLTGLGNRKAFDEQLKAALDAAQRTHNPLALLFIDLDRFKEVNDRYGHDAGDALLIAIGARLRQTLRQPDRFFRVGGDEFIMLLPATSRAAASKLAERLLGALATPIELSGVQIDFVTLSIGIALYPEHADSPEALTKAADSAMYQAKQQRNRACVYQP
ncbi:diguanylate cyclase [Pseudomonas cavernae]|uniref:Diguanylate cyclase n=1 Tax=Pseudomonas cavernae TaxID=2320867 RepID=A0A385YZ50_9PSED|nr:diguanylate cyclase [Pseudomonas cavernae]AYC31814.1 diguanylate cyclase [Pseudomonas cavernae]